MIQLSPLRRHHDQLARLFCIRLNGFDTVVNRFTRKQHSRTTAERFVVDRFSFPLRPVTIVPGSDVHQAVLNGQLQQTLPDVSGEHFGKECQNIKPHERDKVTRVVDNEAAYQRGEESSLFSTPHAAARSALTTQIILWRQLLQLLLPELPLALAVQAAWEPEVLAEHWLHPSHSSSVS